MWEEKSSFKNTPRDFTQVFRGKITNTEVESAVVEKKYFMRGALLCKGSSFGRVAEEVALTQPSSLPSENNDLLFQDPRQDFELILVTLSSHWENSQAPILPMRTHLPGWDCCPASSPGSQRQICHSDLPLPTLLVAQWDLSLFLPSFPSIFLIRLFLPPLLGTAFRCIHPPLPAFFFIIDDILPVKMDQIILQWVHFIFISRTAVWNICT